LLGECDQVRASSRVTHRPFCTTTYKAVGRAGVPPLEAVVGLRANKRTNLIGREIHQCSLASRPERSVRFLISCERANAHDLPRGIDAAGGTNTTAERT
jgi:hypothetical protein